ncbi:MAG: dockerin type I repeat-containing protein [Ruminococcus sp.]
MKTKLSKKLLSVALSLLICISALPLSMISASAAEYDITIRNIVYPRPGVAPQCDITYSGNFDCELLGWQWTNYSGDMMAAGPEAYKSFILSMEENSYGAKPSELKSFTDTEKYNFYAYFVIKNKIISADTPCTTSFYDETGELIRTVDDSSFIPASEIIAELPEGVTLPSGITENDTFFMCFMSNLMCSPADHMHQWDSLTCDSNYHWTECNICGKKIANSEYKHYKGANVGEAWTCVQKATETQEGLYIKKCYHCKYILESITVPKTDEQTIVTSYDELREALAKGGTQWITIDYKWIVQEDYKRDYSLCVDDPNADITIDLNGSSISRTTMYDNYLFNVKRGSLRIWQSNYDNIDENNLHNLELITGANNENKAVFNVEEEGSLRLTNVHAFSVVGSFPYTFSIVKSKGNLRIDSGVYKSYTGYETIDVSSGSVVINGGKYFTTHNSGKALSISGTDDSKTTAEINYGTFGGRYTAVGIYKNADVTINGGDFYYKDAKNNEYQECAVYAENCDLTINDGSFYGSEYALSADCLNSLKIANGYFKLFDETPDYNESVLYLYGDHNSAATIYGGSFIGKTGIYSNCAVNLSKIIPSGCNIYDSNGKIDTTATVKSIGTGYTMVDAPRPVITTQPSGGHSSVMGDAIVLNIDAENANEYIWHIIDEDGHELTWNYLSNNGYTTPNVHSGGKMLMLREVSDWMTGKRVYCEVKGYGGTVMSDIVTLSVDKVIKYCNDIYFDDFDQIWNHKTVGDFKNPKNDADAPYTIGNVRWEMFSKILSDDFEFESGDNVAVRIDVIPKEGYTFYSSVFGKLNGIESYATIKNEDGSRSLVFTMKITAPDEYKTQNIELSVTPPVAGGTPASTAKCTSGYAVAGTPQWTPVDTTFQSGTQYTVKIPVTAEYEWGDTSAVTAKVNGKDAEFEIERKGAKIFAYYVVYTFDATSDFIMGDANSDGQISVLDVTEIQRYLAHTVDFDSTQKKASDVDGDGSITVSDVAVLQQFLAHIITSF